MMPGFLRFFLLVLGTLTLVLGILGIFVPGLPTTPFLLLTAALYARGSDRFYQWLLRNPLVGKYITHWKENRGLTLRGKVKAVGFMVVVVVFSCIFLIESTPVRILVIVLGLVGVIVMGFIIPTVEEK